MSENLVTQVPAISTPIFDANGYISTVWYQFFSKLVARTGGIEGSSVGSLQEEIEELAIAAEGLEGNVYAAPPVTLMRPSNQDVALGLPVPVSQRPGSSTEPFMAASHGLQVDPELHAAVTALVNGFMLAADKAKLDALPAASFQPVVLLADVVTQNTTADGPVLTLNVPANTLQAGSTIAFRMFATVSSAASSGTLTVWLKFNIFKVLSLTFTIPAAAQSGRGIWYEAELTMRTGGAAATVQMSAQLSSDSNALNAGPIIATAANSINLTNANTLSIGFTWSVANAANIATAKTGAIYPEKY